MSLAFICLALAMTKKVLSSLKVIVFALMSTVGLCNLNGVSFPFFNGKW